MLPLIGVCLGFMYHNWLALLRSESFSFLLLFAGIPRELSLEIHFATSVEWLSQWSVFKGISQKHCFYSLYPKFSILFSAALSCLELYLVQDIGYPSELCVEFFPSSSYGLLFQIRTFHNASETFRDGISSSPIKTDKFRPPNSFCTAINAIDYP